MPNLNGTGPRGRGMKTGRGHGRCGQGPALEAAEHGHDHGHGHGCGHGHGHGQGRGHGLGHGRGRGCGQGLGLRRRQRLHGEDFIEETAAPVETEGLSTDEQRRVLKAERNRLKAMLREVEKTLQALGAPEQPQEDTQPEG